MTLFDQNKTNFQIDPSKEYLGELVGEGKKFKDAEALAKGKLESDGFIDRLQRENAEMRADFMRLKEEHDAVPRLQELIDRLSKQPDANSELTPDANAKDQKPAIELKDIESLFENKYQEQRSRERQDDNYRTVQSKLRERYGENYQTHLKTTMDSLGLSESFVENMARENPRAFEQIFMPARSNEGFEAPPPSNRRSDPFAPSVKQRDWKFYEAMRKDPKRVTEYWSPKVQNQMHSDAEALGDAFYS